MNKQIYDANGIQVKAGDHIKLKGQTTTHLVVRGGRGSLVRHPDGRLLSDFKVPFYIMANSGEKQNAKAQEPKPENPVSRPPTQGVEVESGIDDSRPNDREAKVRCPIGSCRETSSGMAIERERHLRTVRTIRKQRDRALLFFYGTLMVAVVELVCILQYHY